MDRENCLPIKHAMLYITQNYKVTRLINPCRTYTRILAAEHGCLGFLIGLPKV